MCVHDAYDMYKGSGSLKSSEMHKIFEMNKYNLLKAILGNIPSALKELEALPENLTGKPKN